MELLESHLGADTSLLHRIRDRGLVGVESLPPLGCVGISDFDRILGLFFLCRSHSLLHCSHVNLPFRDHSDHLGLATDWQLQAWDFLLLLDPNRIG
jgi:hypothetical protein